MVPQLDRSKILLVLLLVFLIAPGGITRAADDWSRDDLEGWYVSGYASQWIGGEGSTSLSGLFNFDHLQSSYFYSISAGKELGRPFESYESLYIDVEGQAGFHTGEQEHNEYVGVFLARWESFPWDHELDTSFSVGEGLSWASEVPEREARGAEGSAKLLNYVVFDVSVSPWRKKRWEGFLRVHHRSGVFGLFSDVYGASNFIGLGVRRRF